MGGNECGYTIEEAMKLTYEDRRLIRLLSGEGALKWELSLGEVLDLAKITGWPLSMYFNTHMTGDVVTVRLK